MRKERKLVEIDKRIVIPFDWRDLVKGGQNLGRAEFQVCIKWKRGKVFEYWVYPKQTRLEDYWHFTGGRRNFDIMSYQQLEDPRVWIVNWCKEHKVPMLSIYTPTDAKFIILDFNGISFWRTNVY